MLLGVIADDFTGASDIANTLTKGIRGQGGLRTTQFLGVPKQPALPDVDAGVISLKSRAVAAHEAIAQSLEALSWLQAQGCQQFVFKYCSTFDSTPRGNIGPVAEALAEALGVKGVIACPALPAIGRTVYRGHLFVGDRLLNESGLEKHPLNPMTDPDIRRWLARQCQTPVGLVPWPIVHAGAHQLRAALCESATHNETLVIVDALTEKDLITIGRACIHAPLLTGGSGIAIGLPANFLDKGLASGSAFDFAGIDGPEAILAGSCSNATYQQIEIHAASHPTLNVCVEQVLGGKICPAEIVDFVQSHQGNAPLVYSAARSGEVAATQKKYGRQRVARAFEQLFAASALALVESGVRRLVVAGGETSGAVVSALDLDAFTIGPEIDPGVPVLFTRSDRPFALALKSGNFGTPEFFAKALRMLGRAT